MCERISVIIPVYKVETLLPRCIKSITQQTYRELEIILVDDGSPDDCPQICEEWASRDNRIQVIHKENAGMGRARNTGLQVASGDYVMFVDSDDYLPPDAVRLLYERLCADESDMAIGKHTKAYDDHYRESSLYAWMRDEILSGVQYLENCEGREYPVCAWGKLYRREILRQIEFPDLKCGEDLWIYPLIAAKCQRISIVDALVYYYYQRDESIMHEMTQLQKEDEARATMHMAYVLEKMGYLKNASRWFCRGIEQSLMLANRVKAKEIVKNTFENDAKTRMRRYLPMKHRVALASFSHSVLFHTLKYIQTRKTAGKIGKVRST